MRRRRPGPLPLVADRRPVRALAFVRAEARWLAVGFGMLLVGGLGQTWFIGLAVGAMREAFALSNRGFGGLYTAATLAAALMLPVLAPWIDRQPPARVAAAVAGLLGLACAALALAVGPVSLMAALVALRLLGQGLATQAAFAFVGRWFAVQRGQAAALVSLGFGVGQVLWPAAYVAIAAAAGWRSAWWAAAAVSLLVAAPLLARLAAVGRTAQALAGGAVPSAHAFAVSVQDRDRRAALRDPRFYLALLATLPPSFVASAFFVHQTHLAALRAWPPSLLAAALTLLAATSIATSLRAGRWIDRHGPTALLPCYLVPLALGLLLVGSVAGSWGLLAFMLLYGLTDGMSLALFGTLWPALYGTRHLAAIRSIVSAVMVCGTALSPGLAGWLIDAGVPWPRQLSAAGAACLLVSAILAWPACRAGWPRPAPR